MGAGRNPRPFVAGQKTELLIWTPDEAQQRDFAARIKELANPADQRYFFVSFWGAKCRRGKHHDQSWIQPLLQYSRWFEGANGWKANSLPTAEV